MRGWVIQWGGHSWTDTEATVGHMVAVAGLGFDDWASASPWRSPQVLAAWVAVLVASETGQEIEACLALVGETPLSELLGCIDEPKEPDAGAD